MKKNQIKVVAVVIGTVVAITFSGSAIALPAKQAVASTKLLSLLSVKLEANSETYNRDLFEHWSDEDSDGCDTRDEVLQRESKTKTDCSLAKGTWISLYDGVKTSDSSTFDIDHFVPLKEAWESGASSWDKQTRNRFANDLGYGNSLIAVSASSNRSKGDRDPNSWLPKSAAFTCQYVGRWIAVKYRWGLSVDSAEKKTLTSKLAICGAKSQVSAPTKATIQLDSRPSPMPSSSSTPTSSASLDPRFSSCAEAKRNGYTKPYKQGVNPEYAWYQDRDNDGIVCE